MMLRWSLQRGPISFENFLTMAKVNGRVIDHLWIDNEGPEYELLPWLQQHKEILVCQLNVAHMSECWQPHFHTIIPAHFCASLDS